MNKIPTKDDIMMAKQYITNMRYNAINSRQAAVRVLKSENSIKGRAYPVLKAPTHCGVWGRVFIGSLYIQHISRIKWHYESGFETNRPGKAPPGWFQKLGGFQLFYCYTLSLIFYI
jgi:hypothetical protein